MTRVIIAATPIYGHVAPLRMIAAGLVRRGNQVTFMTGARFRASVEATGATFAALPPEADYDPAELPSLYSPEYADLEPGPQKLAFEVREMFIKPVPAQHAALQRLLAAAGGEPVAVLHDTSFVGAMPVLLGAPGIRPAAVIGIGVVPLTISSADTAPFGLGLAPDASPEGRERNRAANQAVQEGLFGDLQKTTLEVLRSTGATQDPPFIMDAGVSVPDRYLHLSVEGLEYPRSDAPAGLRFIGTLPDEETGSSAPLPPWWPEVTAAERVIVVTQGTVANRDFSELIEPALEALADLDVLVVAALGRDAQLASVPANARVAEFIPFARLLPHTSVLVSNGGYGGVQQALRHSVPMVLAGVTEDKIEATARAAWTGAAVNLATQRPSAADLRKAVVTVLDTPSFKDHAARLSAEYARHDALGEISAAIREVITERSA